MGIAYRNGPNLSVAVWTGLITEEETDRYLRHFAGDPEWAANGRVLTDLTGLAEESRPSDDRIDVSAEMFRALIGPRANPVKWAVVADRTFEEATKFSERVATDPPRLIVFTDQAAACEWLGVDFAEVGPIIDDLRHEAERSGA